MKKILILIILIAISVTSHADSSRIEQLISSKFGSNELHSAENILYVIESFIDSKLPINADKLDNEAQICFTEKYLSKLNDSEIDNLLKNSISNEYYLVISLEKSLFSYNKIMTEKESSIFINKIGKEKIRKVMLAMDLDKRAYINAKFLENILSKYCEVSNYNCEQESYDLNHIKSLIKLSYFHSLLFALMDNEIDTRKLIDSYLSLRDNQDYVDAEIAISRCYQNIILNNL